MGAINSGEEVLRHGRRFSEASDGSTLGDELKNASEGTKVFGVSIKSRSAILPSGHRADGAFWFDDSTGNFVTSSYYMKELPDWAKAFNDQKLPLNTLTRNGRVSRNGTSSGQAAKHPTPNCLLAHGATN